MNRLSLLSLAAALNCAPAISAGLYQCAKAEGGVTYGYTPCGNRGSAALAIDRASPEPSRDVSPDTVVRSAIAPHRLSQQERERIARLRRGEPAASTEAHTAAEIEIAAIREGADANVSAQDRGELDALRSSLFSNDPRARAEALQRWQAIYARYRQPARPRLQPALPPLAPHGDVSASAPPPSPLTTPPRGTEGPLVATPNAQVRGVLPPPTVVDPTTGRVLAPAGSDRMIDPLTGTMWMRSGRVYVDPATGRVVPAP